MLIGYANICSSIQNHKQSFLIYYKVLKEQKRAKESTRLKLKASEEKCSWSDDVIRSKFIRSISSEARLLEAEVHKKIRDLKLQRLINGFNLVYHCIRLKEWSNGRFVKEFESIECLFSLERWQKTIVRTVQPLLPLLCSCLCIKTRIKTMLVSMFLPTRNAFEIDPS